MATAFFYNSHSYPSCSFHSRSPSPALWNYLWILMFFCLLKDLSYVKAESTILLPSQPLHQDSFVNTLSACVPRCSPPDDSLNNGPVIGILSHPGDGASGRLSNETNASYIAASYVKFVESGGARVIPIIYNEPEEIIFEKLNLVNGIVFTGGRVKEGLYYETVEKIFKKSLEKNDAGDHFPVFAICLGFELLSMIISKDRNILESFGALNQASTLQFLKNTDIEGTVFQRFPPELLIKMGTDCLVLQDHRFGVSPEGMQKHLDLSSFFKILTTSVDENDKVYVSTVQAYNYPVTGMQWHPEKNAFEWASKAIPHSEDAILVSQHTANFLISEARKSSNRPPAQNVLDNLIYNYSPAYGGRAGKGFDQVYIFT